MLYLPKIFARPKRGLNLLIMLEVLDPFVSALLLFMFILAYALFYACSRFSSFQDNLITSITYLLSNFKSMYFIFYSIFRSMPCLSPFYASLMFLIDCLYTPAILPKVDLQCRLKNNIH